MTSPGHGRRLKQHEQHRYPSNHQQWLLQRQSGSISRSVICEQTQEDAGTKDEKAFETLISYDHKAMDAKGAGPGEAQLVGSQADHRALRGRQELFHSQDNHLVILGNVCEIESADGGEAASPPQVVQKGSQSLRERPEGANEGHRRGADGEGSSMTKDEIRFLRATDSDGQFNTTEQDVKSQSHANGPAANLMTLIKSFELSQSQDEYTIDDHEGADLEDQNAGKKYESKLSRQARATDAKQSRVSLKQSLRTVDKSIDALNEQRKPRRMELEPPNDPS